MIDKTLIKIHKNIYEKLNISEIDILTNYIIKNNDFEDNIINFIYNLMQFIYIVSIDSIDNRIELRISVEEDYYLSFYNLKNTNIFYLCKLYGELYQNKELNTKASNIVNMITITGSNDLIPETILLLFPAYKTNIQYNKIIEQATKYININVDEIKDTILKILSTKHKRDYNIIDYLLYLKLYEIIYISNNIFTSLLNGTLNKILIDAYNLSIQTPNDPMMVQYSMLLMTYIKFIADRFPKQYEKNLIIIKTIFKYFYNK